MTIGLLGGRVGCVIPAAKHENMTIMNIEWPCVILVTFFILKQSRSVQGAKSWLMHNEPQLWG